MQTYRIITQRASVYDNPNGAEIGLLTIDTELHGRPAATRGYVQWIEDDRVLGYVLATAVMEVRVKEYGR